MVGKARAPLPYHPRAAGSPDPRALAASASKPGVAAVPPSPIDGGVSVIAFLAEELCPLRLYAAAGGSARRLERIPSGTRALHSSWLQAMRMCPPARSFRLLSNPPSSTCLDTVRAVAPPAARKRRAKLGAAGRLFRRSLHRGGRQRTPAASACAHWERVAVGHGGTVWSADDSRDDGAAEPAPTPCLTRLRSAPFPLSSRVGSRSSARTHSALNWAGTSLAVNTGAQCRGRNVARPTLVRRVEPVEARSTSSCDPALKMTRRSRCSCDESVRERVGWPRSPRSSILGDVRE